jgi:putative ABC transport system substrate-binding protein
VSRVAVLYNPEVLAAVRELQEAEKAARALALRIQPIKAVVAADLPPSFDVIETQKSNALFVQGDPFSMTHRKQILEFATTRKLPVISIFGDFAEAGALMSYGPSRIEMFKRAALFVDKLLKGAKPSDLPIEQPTKLEFIVNLKTAKQLGLRIPPNVLARANRVIK